MDEVLDFAIKNARASTHLTWTIDRQLINNKKMTQKSEGLRALVVLYIGTHLVTIGSSEGGN